MPERLITEELRTEISKLAVPNIAVIGRTGVGKSTIINTVFSTNLAPTGAGLPITQGFCRYPKEGSDHAIPIVIYDSAGYEAGKEQKFVETVLDFLNEKQKEGIDKQIHLVWYIINASSARVEYFEKEIIDKINAQLIPVIIVLSQCDRAQPEEIRGVEKALKTFNLNNVYDTIQVSASPLIIKQTGNVIVFGLTCTAVFEKMAKDNLHGKGKEEIKEYLRDSFKKEFEKYRLWRINSLQELDIVKKNFLNPS